MGPPKILIFGESGSHEDFNESVIQSVSECAERERCIALGDRKTQHIIYTECKCLTNGVPVLACDDPSQEGERQ